MGRKIRPTHAGLFHVTSRSIAEEHVFSSDDDYVDGLGQIAALVHERRLVCHACCLMPTHYHLLASFEDRQLAPAIQRLNRRYAVGFNARNRRRRGHVFDSPYTAVEVADERHLSAVVSYVARNPSSHRSHPWSSYPGTVGLREPFSFVDASLLVGFFGSVERLRDHVETWQPTSTDIDLLAGRLRAATRSPVPGPSRETPPGIPAVRWRDGPGTGAQTCASNSR